VFYFFKSFISFLCPKKVNFFTLQRFRFSFKGYAGMKSLKTAVFREYYICPSIFLPQVFLPGARWYMRILTSNLMSEVTLVC